MITLDENRQTRESVRPYMKQAPCVFSEPLSDRIGCGVCLKFENLRRTGSFKEPGAGGLPSCVISATAGNHGQARVSCHTVGEAKRELKEWQCGDTSRAE